MSIEVMKQALAQLKHFDDGTIGGVAAACEALRQAIEQAEKQEPVAWLNREYVTGLWYADAFKDESAGLEKSRPLYTAPPARVWVGLTDEEVKALGKTAFGITLTLDGHLTNFANAIADLLKAKNSPKETT